MVCAPSLVPPVSARALDHDGLRAVDAMLRARTREWSELLTDVGGDLEPVVATLREAVEGGKRLRAAFCLWGARAASGGGLPEGAVEAAAALEMFHLAALVHDDVMDHSDARRGRPTVHRRFADAHAARAGRGDADDHGAAVAVLAGDLCLTWSDDLLAAATAAAPVTASAVRGVWSRMRTQVIAGQYLDVLGQTEPASTAEVRRVRRVLQFKSAKYTAEHPLLLGGALAGGPEDLMPGLAAFGLAVGEAFQLRDDVLGVFGDPDATGKPVLDDVREGKRTLLVALAEEAADGPQRAVLRRRLGDPTLDERGLAEVREVLTATGALHGVEARIDALVGEARSVLGAMPVDRASRAALGGLTAACAWRAA